MWHGSLYSQLWKWKAAQLVFSNDNIHKAPQSLEPFGTVPIATELFQVPDVPHEVATNCTIKLIPLFSRLLIWIAAIHWEKEPTGCTLYLELCLDYIFSTKRCPPVPIEKFPNRKKPIR